MVVVAIVLCIFCGDKLFSLNENSMYDDGIMNTTLTNKHFFDVNNRSKNITKLDVRARHKIIPHFNIFVLLMIHMLMTLSNDNKNDISKRTK